MVVELVSTPPLVECVEQLEALLAAAADAQAIYLSDEDKRRMLLGIARVERRLAGLKLQTMAASADVADSDGARDVAAWLASRTRAEARPLRQEQRLADAVDQRWTRLGAAMSAGEVSVEQAYVIVQGLEAIPARVGVEVIARAEAQLVELARCHNATELRILARRILDLVAPEIAEAEEARRLEDEERQARTETVLRHKRLGHGQTRTTIIHPDASADRLQAYCEAYTSPRKHTEAISGEEDRIPYPRRLGQAFVSLLEHLDPTRLPQHGGTATSVFVTIPLESLQSELGVGEALSGERMSATAVRRLACTAGIIPVVLGGKGEILDLGRTRRLFTTAQRKALALRDRRCRGEGCGIPAAWTEAHHLKPWSTGGRTDLADGILACSHHHHLLHDPRYTHEVLPTGDIRFHRRR